VGRNHNGRGGIHRGASARANNSGAYRLGDGAGAVGDGEGGGLGDSVGLAAVSDLGRLGAVGGVGGHDLSNVGRSGGVLVGIGVGASNEGEGSGDDGELHFDCWGGLLRWY